MFGDFIIKLITKIRRFFILSNKEKSKTKNRISDVVFDSNLKILNLKKKIPLIEIHTEEIEKYLKRQWLPLLNVLGVFLLIVTFASFFPSHASISTFYPESCLGGWENSENASGIPSLPEGAEIKEYNKSNSAFIKGTSASIYCGAFQGKIPADTTPKHFSLSFSLSVDDGSVIHNETQPFNIPEEITSVDVEVIEDVQDEIPLNSEEEITDLKSDMEDSLTNSDVSGAEDNNAETTEPESTSDSNEVDNKTTNNKTTEDDIISPVPDPTPEPAEDNTTSTDSSQVEPISEPIPEPPPAENQSFFWNYFSMPVFAQETTEELPTNQEENVLDSSVTEMTPLPPVEENTTKSDLLDNSDNNQEETFQISDSEVSNTANSDVTDNENTITNNKEEFIIPSNENETNYSAENDIVIENTSQDEIIEKTSEEKTAEQVITDSFMEVAYTLDGINWNPLGKISRSNWQNVSFGIPLRTWDDLSKFQVSLSIIPTFDRAPVVYLDAVRLNVEYDVPEIVEELPVVEITDSSSLPIISVDKDYFSSNEVPSFTINNPNLSIFEIDDLIKSGQATVISDPSNVLDETKKENAKKMPKSFKSLKKVFDPIIENIQGNISEKILPPPDATGVIVLPDEENVSNTEPIEVNNDTSDTLDNSDEKIDESETNPEEIQSEDIETVKDSETNLSEENSTNNNQEEVLKTEVNSEIISEPEDNPPAEKVDTGTIDVSTEEIPIKENQDSPLPDSDVLILPDTSDLNDSSQEISVINPFSRFIHDVSSLFAVSPVLAQTANSINIVEAEVLDGEGNNSNINANIKTVSINGQLKQYVEIQKPERSFRPGRYVLKVKFRTRSAIFVSSQNFTWGVLAINVDQSIYEPGDEAYLQFGVLNDGGHTICDAQLDLEIKTPSGIISSFSTEDGSIVRNNECGPDNVIENPDYYAYYNVPNETGDYEMMLTATTINGVKTITDNFSVSENLLFKVKRKGPTRIYPLVPYPVTFYVTAKNDWVGTITEKVPIDFDISQPKRSKKYDSVTMETNPSLDQSQLAQIISWNVSLKAGEEIMLGYYFDAPDISPEFYLFGPAQFFMSTTLGFKTIIPQFEESRKWQIASDGTGNNLTINNSTTTNAGTAPNWVAGIGGGNVNITDIQTQINNGTSVSFTAAGDITVSNAFTKTLGADVTMTMKADGQIIINAAISSTTNKMNMVLNADRDADSSGYVNIAASLTSNGGDITIGGGSGTITAGSGYAVGNSGQATGVYINNVSVSAGGGNIIINGQGYDTTTNNNYGVHLYNSSGTVDTTGTGTIDINAIAKGNTNSASNYGLYINAGGIVSVANGNVTVTATGGGAGTGGNNYGVYITDTKSTIVSTGSGNVSVTGTGGNDTGSGTYNSGITCYVSNCISSTGTGTVTITGNGGNGHGTGSNNNGIYINGLSSSITNSGGAMTITANGGTSTGNNNYGIRLNSSSSNISNTGSGTIDITAYGGGSSNSGYNYGIVLSSGAYISTINGNLTITTTGGGAGTGIRNYGIQTNGDGNTVKTTGSGNLSITATGGNASGSGGYNNGIDCNADNCIQTTGTGSITINATGGNGSGSGTQNNGISISSTGNSITGNGGNMTITATGGGSTGSTNYGIYLSNSGGITNIGSGTLTITGTGGGVTNSGSDAGLYVYASTISAVNGDLIITGNGGGAGTGSNNYGIQIHGTGGTVKTTGSGNVSVTATGGNASGSGSTNYGVSCSITNCIQTTGTGTITVNGTGGNGSGSGLYNYGVYLSGSITGNGGAMNITGTGGNSSGRMNYGIYVNGASSTINNASTGTLTVTANGGGASANSYGNSGLYINAGSLYTADGNLTINTTGGGAGTGISNYGIYFISTGATIKTTGSGNVSVTATGGNASGSGSINYGIYCIVANCIQTTGTGTLTVNATGGNGSGSGGTAYGLYIANSGSSITGNGGAMTITGTGGNSSGNTNRGIYMSNGSITNTGSGTLTVTANGGGNTNSANARALEITAGAVISTVNGNLIITATGSGAGTGGNNYGIYINGTSTTIKTTGSGNLSVTGTGGNPSGSGGYNYGVYCNIANCIQATGTGTITIDGTGGNNTSGSGTGNYGVYVGSVGTITSAGGDITITATGGGSSGSSNRGFYLAGTSGSITNTGSGAITITATGGGTVNSASNYGFYIYNTGVISAVNGDITITATGGGAGTGTNNYGFYLTSTSSTIKTTGSGNLIITGIRGGGNTSSNYGMVLNTANALQTTLSGNITAITDTILLYQANDINSIADLTIRPYTSSSTVGVGSGSGTLALSDTYLGYLTWGASNTLTIGGTSAGDIDINTASTILNKNVTFLTGGNITLGTTALTHSGASASTLNMQAYGNITTTSAITADTSALTVLLQSDYDGDSSGYINLGAGITSNGGNITIGGGSGTITAGSGYAAGNSGQAYGVYINNSGITSAGGNVIINGQGYNTTTDSNHGVYISGASASVTTTGSGTINIYGNGGGLSGNSKYNYGLYPASGGIISTVDGNLTIVANGGGAGSGNVNAGIRIDGTNTTIKTTGTGNISITGTAGDTTSGTGSNTGIFCLISNCIQTTGTGTITITANGGATTGSNNRGLYLGAGNTITSAGGDITITATAGGSGSGTQNVGVRITGAGAAITNAGSGTITITTIGGGASTSSSNYGIEVDSGGAISTVNGDLTINATGGGGSGGYNYGAYIRSSNSTVKTTGSGNIILNGLGGSGGSNYGLITLIGSALHTISSGNITVSVDKISMNASNSIQSIADLTIRPYTSSSTVGVGSGSGTLALSDTYLGYLTWGASNTLTIGGTSAGDIDINTASTILNKNVTFLTGGNITLGTTALTHSGASASTLNMQAYGNITTTSAITADTSALTVNINADYDSNASGSISLGAGITSNGGVITILGGGGTISSSGAFENLTINTSGNTITLGAGLNITNTLTLTAGTLDTSSNYAISVDSVSIGISSTLRGRNSLITVANDWSNAGTFTADTSEVKFNTGATASIGGGPTTFYDLTITHTSAKEVDFSTTASHIIHVTNDFTVTGTASQLIKLYSDSAGTKWHFHPTGTASVDYADIKDGGCESGSITIFPSNSTDSGNNDSCWNFVPSISFSLGSNNINLGTLSTSSASFGSHTISAATTAPGGFAISYNGPTLTNQDSNTIPVYTSSSSSPGTAGFGINLKNNTTPNVGADPVVNSGTCGIASGYGTADNYSFVASTTTTITNISAPADCVFTTSYVTNISGDTASGDYETIITYTMTGTF